MSKPFILILIALIISFTNTSCQSSNANISNSTIKNPSSTNQIEPISPNSNSNLEELLIKPQITDDKIDNWLEPHYVVKDKVSPSNHKLFLFLSGSFGIPERQKLITQQAAKLGYDAINLRYPNSWTVGKLCKKTKDSDCYGNLRQEILSGINDSPLIEVNQANSLENRLVKLLQYLGWQQYLDGDKPRWEMIVVAGHSQGGGTAFLIAKQHLVAKAIAFSAPVDYNRQDKESADWLTEIGKTPADRYYGFIHLQDQGFKKVLQAWNLLGLNEFGEPVNVDEQNYPYNNSHQLVTDAKPQTEGKYHGSVVVDKNVPLSSEGKPLFESVWNYLLK